MKSGRQEKLRGPGRPSALPSNRSRRLSSNPAGRVSKQGKLVSTAAFSVTILFILFNVWGSPRTRVDTGGFAGQRGEENSASNAGLGEVVGLADASSGKYQAGTDKYKQSRAGEILGTWHPKFGLEIDTWDPRTHNPELHSPKYGEQKYYASALIVNRVWKGDQMNITFYEARQWLEYMRYAGVEHVFWYDTAHSPSESQERALRPYIQKGFVTYHHFQKMYPGTATLSFHFAQDKSAAHCINSYGMATRWLLVADVDEYPFAPPDPSPGFLDRYLREYEGAFPDATQLLLQCMLFQGFPQKELPALLVERYQLREKETRGIALGGSAKLKAIIKPKYCERVYKNNPHHFEMSTGKTVAQPAGSLRLNHYWGPRATDFKPQPTGELSPPPAADHRARQLLAPFFGESNMHFGLL
eukprot:jgi/Mesen1/6237/ME000321S05301